MMYYGSRISDNLSTSPEGFLICHNVPIARTAYQDYLGKELPLGIQEEYELDPNKIYKVYRSVDEVFSPETIASFEGKVFTDDHPPELVTTQNINMYGKGHIQNVRKGAGENSNMLLADIICTDENVANSIREKLKREVSCGYRYIIKKGAKGFEQSQIRGNHVALVENGRAGTKAAIQDACPDAIKQKQKGAKTMKANFFAKMFAAWAKDAEPEEIEKALGAMKDESSIQEGNTNAGEMEGMKKDIADLKVAMVEVTNALKQLVESDKKVHEEVTDEDKLNNLEKEAEDSLENPDDEGGEGEKEDEPSEQLIEADDEDVEEEKEKAMDSDALKALIASMKPKLLAIKDKEARSQAVDAFVAAVNDARVKKPKSSNSYSALTKAIKTHAKALDSKQKPKTIDDRREEQVNAINKYNPHARKEER